MLASHSVSLRSLGDSCWIVVNNDGIGCDRRDHDAPAASSPYNGHAYAVLVEF
jgi:hypothetical protein